MTRNIVMMTKKELKNIEEYIGNTTADRFYSKGFDILRENGGSILNLSKTLAEPGYIAEIDNVGDIDFFVKARNDMPKLLREIERLKDVVASK